jgi:cation transport protein ChaC
VTLITYEHWSTLVDAHSETDQVVWGVAYHIPSIYVKEVKEYLDIREINGYSIHYDTFVPASDAVDAIGQVCQEVQALVYIGTPDNPQFVGPKTIEELAQVIVKNKGPSGENKEYLYKLNEALEELCRDSKDLHIRDLTQRVKQLETGDI